MVSGGKQILNLPIGYRFDPTDNEAIGYLKHKILGRDIPADVIPTVALYSCHPQRIPYAEFRYGTGDKWWFYTSIPNNGNLIVEGIGYWKTIGYSSIYHEGKNIGSKKTRKFFFENPENIVRNENLVILQYVTHEFIVEAAAFELGDLTGNVIQQMENYVLCEVCVMEEIEEVDSEEEVNS